MKNEKSSGPAAAVLNQMLDLMLRADHAPTSPMKKRHQAKERRELRRSAERLRQGKSQPPEGTGCTAEELADIYERTVRRDEIVEREYREFIRLNHELGRVLAENGPEEREKLVAWVDEIERAARENGRDSEAGRRYEHLRILGWFSHQHFHQLRRQKDGLPQHVPLVLLPPPLPSDAVTAIPPQDTEVIVEMPDGNHLFLTTEGAGYIIHINSGTLVEDLGSDVVQVSRDEHLTLFVVYHGDGSLEAFGKSGRRWKTPPLGSGEFRNASLLDNVFSAEASQASGEEWLAFSVDVATGEVRFGEEGGAATDSRALVRARPFFRGPADHRSADQAGGQNRGIGFGDDCVGNADQ